MERKKGFYSFYKLNGIIWDGFPAAVEIEKCYNDIIILCVASLSWNSANSI